MYHVCLSLEIFFKAAIVKLAVLLSSKDFSSCDKKNVTQSLDVISHLHSMEMSFDRDISKNEKKKMKLQGA